MQGLLAAALAPTAPPRSQPSSARPAPAPLSSANLALHTSTNPPAPRRTVQQFLASVTRVHAANAYDLGQPPAGELDHVKTPPRAVEARRKRKLQDLEDRGESWIPRDKTTPRAATTGTEQALVLIRSDADLVHRGSTTSETADVKQHERKKSLVASMMRRKSTPPANASARSTAQRQPLLPISGPSPASNGSSILMPRTETKTATTRQKEGAEERGGKENRAGREKKSSLRKGKNASRRDTDKDAEQEELEEHQARLEARRDRRRQNALIRKDRSLAANAVGAAAAAKLKKSKSKQRPAMTASESNASSSSSEENALETTGHRKRKGKGTRDVRSRKKVAGLDRPQHVGQGRLTLKPVALGIFGKGKASARAKTGAHHHQLAFDEEAFLSGAARNGDRATRSSASSSSSSSSSEESAHEVPSRRPASRNVGNHAPRTYGSRPSKRRSGSAIRQHVPDADDGAPASQEDTPNQDATAGHSSAAAPDRTAAKRPAAAMKKRLAATKKQTPTFELDIPPWPRSSSLARRSRPVDADKGAAAAAADADDADSTHPSILSAASLARRKAERSAAEKYDIMDAEQEIAPGAGAPDAGSFGGGGASVHAPARMAEEPVADDADLWQGADDNVDSANTSGGAFERLLAQVTNAADDSFEASAPLFEALSACSAVAGEFSSRDQPREVLVPEPASEVKGTVLVNSGGGGGVDAYLVGAATIEEEEDPAAPEADNTLISFLNETVFDEAELAAFADLDGAQSASAAAADTFHPRTPDYGTTIPARFPTPSDLSPSFVVADHDDDICLEGGAPTVLLDDEAAFRTAMRQQWPKTLL